MKRAVACLWLGLGSSGWAYEINTSSAGVPTKWAPETIEYVVDSGGPDTLADADAFAAVEASFAEWQWSPRIEFNASRGAVGDWGHDGQNSVRWVQDWDALDLTADAMAVTITFFEVETGEIIEADIAINEAGYGWGPDDEWDLQNAITHEVGHLLGFGHSAEPTATMFALAGPLETEKRSLHADDEAGRAALYGPRLAAPQETIRTPVETPEQLDREVTLPPPRDPPTCAASDGANPAWWLLFLAWPRRRRA